MAARRRRAKRSESWEPERDRGPSRATMEWLLQATPEQFWEYVHAAKLDEDQVERLMWWGEHGHRYHERPVGVRQFLFSKAYMNANDESGKPVLWPALVDAIEEVCEGSYTESVWTGAIGTGKTTGSLYAQAYLLYKLLCEKSPHATYELDPSSEILVVFQSLNKELSAGVDYDRFKAMLDRAPIWSDVCFKYDREIKSEMRFAKRVIVKPLAGVDTSALGQNVIGGMLDEITSMAMIEDSKRTRGKEAYDQAVALYNSIARRRESRFLNQGEMPGMLCLVGSKKYPDDFLHKKLQEARDDPNRIFVYDHVLWDLRPDRFGDARFHVFVGDPTRKPRILEAGEEVGAEDEPLVHDVPTEYATQFRNDLLNSIRDILGAPTLSIHPFILNRDRLAEAFGKVRSVASRPDCDFDATNIQVYPSRWKGTEHFPRLAHFDLALSQDSAGLAIGHVKGFKRMKRSEVVDEIMPVIVYDLVLEIIPPRGGEINFEKLRRLLYLLRENGMPIKWVTADQFQSSDMLQILNSKGFIVGRCSVDKNPGVYELFKTATYDGRILAPEHPKALSELSRLERDPKKGKIDHPVDGSKDVADAMASVAYGLTLQTETWTNFGIDLREVPPTVFEQSEMQSKHDLEGRV